MATYKCAYAYDVPHFADFIVEANSKKEAERIIEQTLAEGKLRRVAGESDDSIYDERVFVMEKMKAGDLSQHYEVTLEELINSAEDKDVQSFEA